MKKRIVAMLLLTALVTSSCGKTEQVLTPTEEPNQGSSEQATDSSKAENPATDTVSTSGDRSATLINASFLGDSEEVYYNKDLVPSVAPYSVSADFSNVVYDDEFDYLFDLSQQSEYNNVKARREALIKNNFYVEASSGESEFFDVYEDAKLGADMKSVAVSLMFRDDSKTLTDADIKDSYDKILDKLAKNYEAKLR